MIVRGRKPVWAFEVKIGGFTRQEAVESVKRMARIAQNVGLISLRERSGDYGNLSLGPRELVEMARRMHEEGLRQ